MKIFPSHLQADGRRMVSHQTFSPQRQSLKEKDSYPLNEEAGKLRSPARFSPSIIKSCQSQILR